MTQELGTRNLANPAMLTFDIHLDLSINALAPYNRDLRRTVHEIRHREQGMTDIKGRAAGTVAFPEMRKGRIGLCVVQGHGGMWRDAPDHQPAAARGNGGALE
jgi:hypothetical protein